MTGANIAAIHFFISKAFFSHLRQGFLPAAVIVQACPAVSFAGRGVRSVHSASLHSGSRDPPAGPLPRNTGL